MCSASNADSESQGCELIIEVIERPWRMDDDGSCDKSCKVRVHLKCRGSVGLL